MRAPLFLSLCALALSPGVALAQAEGPSAPTGVVVTGSLAVGGETGLASGKSGLLELEVGAGWEHQPTRLRPELALALGVAPGTSVALRPGLRAGLADVPVWLRAALDLSTARGGGLHTRWLLFGAAWQLQFSTTLAFDLGLDFGIPLAGSAGVPFMLRGGGTFRL